MSTPSERDKMLAGVLYDATDPELVAMHARAVRLSRAYNDTDPADAAERRRLLEDLLGTVGERVVIEPPFRCDYGRHIHLGDGVYMNFNTVILDCNHVRIGDQTQFGPNVTVAAATHPLDAAERVKGPELAHPVTIGRRVWIAAGAIIGPGVTIGDDATIGAGSVVTRDIPEGVLAAGNPCKVIREL